jgi:hypothetical protein
MTTDGNGAGKNDDANAKGAAKPPASATDLARTVGEMRRLLEQIEEADRAAGDSASEQHLAVVARMLQYVHDSHGRIVETLKEQDRSELFLQSTQALNQTFRRLNQSQDALVEKLLAERRRNPWYLVAGAALVAVVAIAALFVLIDHRNGGLRDEVERMAAARDGLGSIAAESQRAFNEMGTKLAESVDKTLAANRVLDNENRARAQELADTARRAELEAEKAQRDERMTDLERDRTLFENQVADLRAKLLDKELAATNIEKLLDERLGKRVTEPDAAPAAPDSAIDAPAPATTEVSSATASPAVADSAATVVSPGEPAGEATGESVSAPNDAAPPPEEAAGDAVFDPTTRAVNDFLGAAGVIDHRLLRQGGIRDGELRDVVFELRSAEGRPIGSRSAQGLKIRVDPGTLTAQLVLRGGETVERGQRTPFPEEGFEVEIAAIARESLTIAEILPFLALDAPIPEVKPEIARSERFDSREPLALLNRELGDSGRGYVRFAVLRGIDAGRLIDVELNHYTGAGALMKTVVARSCDVDRTARRVRLVFRDGHHVQNGREVPFFKGRGDGESAPTWTLDLEDADPEAWTLLRERFTTERFVD